MRLPLEPLVSRTGSRFNVEPSLGPSPFAMVVRRAALLRIGAVLGLSTLFFQSPSRSLLTIRRAALADSMAFSFGGLHEVAAVGLLRLWVRLIAAPEFPFIEERRLIADPILRASD